MKTTTAQKQEILMHRLGELLSHDLGYIYGEREGGPNGEKKEFLDKGKRFLTQLGKDLGFTEMKVSKNPAGIAVSGDVTLCGIWSPGNGLYISLSEPVLCDWCVLYRTIKDIQGRYSGVNQQLSITRLQTGSYSTLVAEFMSYYGGSKGDRYERAA